MDTKKKEQLTFYSPKKTATKKYKGNLVVKIQDKEEYIYY